MVGDTADIILKPFEEYRRGAGHQDNLQSCQSSGSIAVARRSTAPSFAMLPLPGGLVHERNPRYAVKTSLQNGDKTAGRPGALVTAAASGVKSFAGHATKGVLVDVPLALTEGLWAVPHLYGDPVKKHGAVEDFRSGLSVAGKSFYEGMRGGLTDIFVQTYGGKKEQGATGAVKGLGKGVASFVTKSSAAALGLVSYPSLGIYRSIWSARKGAPRRTIEEEKLLEGHWITSTNPRWKVGQAAILEDFDGLRGARDG